MFWLNSYHRLYTESRTSKNMSTIWETTCRYDHYGYFTTLPPTKIRSRLYMKELKAPLWSLLLKHINISFSIFNHFYMTKPPYREVSLRVIRSLWIFCFVLLEKYSYQDDSKVIFLVWKSCAKCSPEGTCAPLLLFWNAEAITAGSWGK